MNLIAKNLKTALLSLFLVYSGILFAQTPSDSAQSSLSFRAIAEAGFLGVLEHNIQLGKDGTNFDYVANGGQDVLFPTLRFSLEMDIRERNTLVLLYQPLRIKTQALLKEDLVANGTTFPANTGLNCLYSFPFYRISYLRQLTRKNQKFNFSFGGTMQIRNATISFESTDGILYTDSRDVGLVPALKIRSRYNFSDKVYTEMEADGIYAPISYLNGSDNDVEGAILDASLRLGTQVNSLTDAYFNIRYLGGGSTGTASDNEFPGDGYAKNWLNFLNVTTGFVLHL